MSKKNAVSSAAQDVVDLIQAGLDAKKCRRCGKMAGVIEVVGRTFEASGDPAVRAFAEKIGELRSQALKQASGDMGCSGCWGSKARKALSKGFKPVKAGRTKKAKKAKSEPQVIEATGSRPLSLSFREGSRSDSLFR